ncbi:hypothetical protein KIW84_035556 [Lathyrus oleraceus]|uniref:Uncharacterized protein n=1 Tax=Pisum sativum TaxID=3888 RepID=A0A9D4Y1V4_PEA|nr:hypothetical protein KIW84_035556 [Pisum sativum]
MRIEDRELKQLRGKEIALVKVTWGGPAGGNVTWELENLVAEKAIADLEILVSGHTRMALGNTRMIWLENVVRVAYAYGLGQYAYGLGQEWAIRVWA